MARRNGKWISVKAVNRSMNALIQSWQRTKTNGLEAFKKNMELLSNASNNTVYADDKGNIAYWHGNFIPKRDTAFDWDKPVDGSTSATEWKGLHALEETIHLYNPSSGWIQNCNSTPFTAAGASSPVKRNYPAYMATEPDNFRGINAVRLLSREPAYTIDKLIATGYDTYLTAFEELIPAFTSSDSLLTQPLQLLHNWDLRASASSIATTLAIEWITRLMTFINREPGPDLIARVRSYARGHAIEKETALKAVMDDLTVKFGTWRVAWGDINRYQRLTGQLQERYDDSAPSLPCGMAASTWGCLPSFVSRYMNGSQKRYGYNGNSFVCAVEFGPRVKAKSLLAGGNSSDPSSPHFGDQAKMYTEGIFKDVLFYKEDVLNHATRSYHPGE
jgi:acyl-homoserine lactone acylase PvdQ